jgi:UDP-glucose 4-epimerase
MSKVLVTGGCGFIGSHLVEELVKRGYNVVVIDDFSTGQNRNNAAKTYKASVCNFSKVLRILKKEKPEKIIHLAAKARIQPSLTQPLEYNNTNVVGTLNVFEAARRQGITKVLFASSSSVMFGTEKIPYNELDLPKPTTPYSLTKYIDELYATLYNQVYAMETVGFRFFNVYGTRMAKGTYKTVITIFANQVKKNIPLTIVGDGTQKRDFTHVADIVEGIILALERENLGGEIFNLGRSKSISIEEVATLVAGKNYPRERGHKRIGETSHTLSNTTKAKELLGWEAKIDLKDGILEVLEEEGISKN